jgi:hypothetical protein
MRIILDIEDANAEYFDACARIRNISPRALIRRVLDAIAEDCMVANVLDDQDAILSRRKGEHRYRPCEAVQTL